MRAGAAEAGLHFVGDAETTELARDRVGFFQVIAGAMSGAAHALHRLGNECRDLAGRRETNRFANLVCGFARNFFGRACERRAVRIRIHDVVHTDIARNRKLPRVMRCQPLRAG